MDDQPPNGLADDAKADEADRKGPLGQLLEHSLESRGNAEPESATQSQKSSERATVTRDYAEGTHEHDDDSTS